MQANPSWTWNNGKRNKNVRKGKLRKGDIKNVRTKANKGE
jgi:hypothetical protein